MSGKTALNRNRSKKYLEFKDLQKLSKKLKKDGKKIVFTTGSFDLLNPGHCRYLADAKASGDILVVGISSDSSDRRIKGSKYPLIPEEIRAELITHLKTVDYVTIVDNDRPHAALIMLQPDTFYTCDHDWNIGLRTAQDQLVLDTYGGKIFREPIIKPYYSLSGLVGKIAHIRFMQILQRYLSAKFSHEVGLDVKKTLSPVDFGEQKPTNLFAFNAGQSLKNASDWDSSSKPNPALKTSEIPRTPETPKTVLVSGTYDLLHVGHARFISRAARQGDFLIVAIPSDKAVSRLKGTGRPVMSERSRAYVLASLDIVDAVVIFPEIDVLKTLHKIKPDVFYTVKDSWNKGYKESPEYKFVTSYGGKVVRGAKQSTNISASGIIDRLAYEKVQEIFKECMNRGLYEDIAKERSRLNGRKG